MAAVIVKTGFSARGPGRLEGGGGGLFGGDLGLDAGLRAGQSGLDRVDRGEPGFDPGCSGLGVAGRFAAGVHPDHPVAID